MVKPTGPDVIWKYFSDTDDTVRERISRLAAIYQQLNAQVNVISRKDIEHLYLHHVLHSLSLVSILKTLPSKQILDLGTGGGFPGIPLAIFLTHHHITMIDGSNKKIRIVQQVIDALGLRNAVAKSVRAESMQAKFDHIVCRAVAPTRQILKWSKNLCADHTRFELLKGGNLTEELAFLPRSRYLIHHISDSFQEPYFTTKRIVSIKAP